MRDTIEIGSDGALQGIRVMGCHGIPSADETPARMAPILADQDGRFVRIEVVEPGRLASIERSESLIAEGNSFGEGMRLGPWPARLDDVLVVLGPREFASALLRQPKRTHNPRVASFLTHVVAGQTIDEELRFEV